VRETGYILHAELESEDAVVDVFASIQQVEINVSDEWQQDWVQRKSTPSRRTRPTELPVSATHDEISSRR
jgi:hypothetical protein